ncbi:alpha-rhamnosidase [Paenibacillus agaridevorans]|uniref:Alpha-rhamnosidase n=1 Tax=Paenibacillus agaridevorans TaxID=171404 RepID=A0A2R5EQ09_9BACL|nr:alpha-L-rhamnosidase C-terminal domain-containing protein [Paenibacillus agaridevorans]GBG05853.1 alpha-rhamnosidase [Paenibacillus agaridevorans]
MGDKQAQWIWYPGDFEIWLRREVEFRRDERGVIVPPIWRVDGPYTSVRFRKTFVTDTGETVKFSADGAMRLQVNGATPDRIPEEGIWFGKGEYALTVEVHHLTRVPSLFVQGETLVSDDSWEVSQLFFSGFVKAGKAGFTDAAVPPSDFRLETMPIEPVKIEPGDRSLFLDFGRQTFGYMQLHDIEGEGKIRLVYGESEEEANDFENCETFDELVISSKKGQEAIVQHSRALRYVRISWEEGVSIDRASLLYEYLPVEYRGSFRCSNDTMNRIWDVAAYTLHLNTREFFLDGLKRDRWVWSGDAYQSYLMNYYLFFDLPTTRRTIVALRGKDPVDHHLNTILDYSLYWFMGLKDYYLYTGDLSFIREQYGRMIGLMDYCINRTNADGMLEGQPGDWVFVDWADIEKEGELAFEQMLFCLSLETVSMFAELLGEAETVVRYHFMAGQLRGHIQNIFWDEEQEAYIHRRVNGAIDSSVTRHPNMMALLFGFLDPTKKKTVKRSVMLNPAVPAITTPYMRFYELAAMCEIGEHAYVLDEMLGYWGGMLELGATSFWEEYDPHATLSEQYAMYGRKYGKSLCHAWGASPLYLTGKYFLGVTPAKPGYEEILIRPALGGLEWMEGKVPVPAGEVALYMDTTTIRVSVPAGTGRLQFRSGRSPESIGGVLYRLEPNLYELRLDKPGHEYVVYYAAEENR